MACSATVSFLAKPLHSATGSFTRPSSSPSVRIVEIVPQLRPPLPIAVPNCLERQLDRRGHAPQSRLQPWRHLRCLFSERNLPAVTANGLACGVSTAALALNLAELRDPPVAIALRANTLHRQRFHVVMAFYPVLSQVGIHPKPRPIDLHQLALDGQRAGHLPQFSDLRKETAFLLSVLKNCQECA